MLFSVPISGLCSVLFFVPFSVENLIRREASLLQLWILCVDGSCVTSHVKALRRFATPRAVAVFCSRPNAVGLTSQAHADKSGRACH